MHSSQAIFIDHCCFIRVLMEESAALLYGDNSSALCQHHSRAPVASKS